MTTSVLLLAGSTEAADLARRLHGTDDIRVLASFAGRIAAPGSLPCPTRVGGFGGTEGLVNAIRDSGHDRLVDATHPFAARMSAHAVEAARQAGVPHLRLLRPPWTPIAGDRWHEVDDLAQAATWLASHDMRSAFLATGRQEVAPFADLPGLRFVLRSIDPPGPLALPDATFVVARGPFDIAAERALLRRHGVEVVVTRNSGGDATRAKLDAARELDLPVVMVRRPPPAPDATVVETVAEAEAWVRDRA